MTWKQRIVLVVVLVGGGVGVAVVLRASSIAEPGSWLSLAIAGALLMIPVGLVAWLVRDRRVIGIARREWLARHEPLPTESFSAAIRKPCDPVLADAVRAAVAAHSGIPADRVHPDDRLQDLVTIGGEGWDWQQFAFTIEETLRVSVDEQQIREGLIAAEPPTVATLVLATQDAVWRSAGRASEG